MALAIVLALGQIVVPLRGAREMGQQVATIPAPIGVQPIAEARIALPTVALPTAVAPPAPNQAAKVASAQDLPVRRQFFRRLLARVCD